MTATAESPASGGASSAGRLGPLDREQVRRKGPWLILAVGMAACAVVLLVLSRHEGFNHDEYFWILNRRAWNANAFLADHNGHFVLVPVVVYKLLFVTVGLGHTWPYRLVLVALHLLCVGLLWAVAAKRMGRWLALLPAALLLWLGAGAQDLLWAFQIGIVGSLAAGLGALLCLDRRDRRGDIFASVLLFVSLASDSVGIPIAIAVAIELLISRERRRRAWVALVPLGLYALWYAGYGTSQVLAANVPRVPAYDQHIAAYGFGGLLGVRGYGQSVFGAQGLGLPLLVVAVGGLGAWLLSGRRIPARSWTAILAALGFWTIVALTRAQYDDPGSERYLYASAVLILLVAVTALRWRRLPLVLLLGLMAVVVFAAYTNLTPLRAYANDRTATDNSVRAALGAAQIAAPVASPTFRPEPSLLPWLDEQGYLAAVRDLGSPAFDLQQLAAAPAVDRAQADRTLIAAEHIASTPGQIVGTCSPLHPGGPGASAVVRAKPGTVVSIRATGSAQVALRRFGSQFEPLTTVTKATSPLRLALPRDDASTVWRIQIRPTGTVTVCAG